MKRLNNIFDEIVSVENLRIAEANARRGKSGSYGVQIYDKNKDENILNLHAMLVSGKFRTSEYDVFKLKCDNGKIRDIYRLPFYPDRIVHHAIMNIMEGIWVSVFTSDTYACIKSRGIHSCSEKIKRALKNQEGTRYCLKMDVKKFYPSVDHEVLKIILRRKIKDTRVLLLLDEIIDSVDEGVPIGNYLSQYFGNLYLSYFDHWLKEQKGVKYYYRYCDDMVILSDSKSRLHFLKQDIDIYMRGLKIEIKGNWQVFPVASRGIDFLGYKFYHTHTLLRKSIKLRFIKSVKTKNAKSLAAYNGWLIYCDSVNLKKKYLSEKI